MAARSSSRVMRSMCFNSTANDAEAMTFSSMARGSESDRKALLLVIGERWEEARSSSKISSPSTPLPEYKESSGILERLLLGTGASPAQGHAVSQLVKTHPGGVDAHQEHAPAASSFPILQRQRVRHFIGI